MQFEKKIEANKTDFELVKCAAPQGSVVGSPLFLLHENGIQLVLNLLASVTFADDTNLFHSDVNVKIQFWGRNFKNLSPDSESALPRYHVCQFSVKTENFDFFGPNLPKKEIRI